MDIVSVKLKLQSLLIGREKAKALIDAQPHFIPLNLEVFNITLASYLKPGVTVQEVTNLIQDKVVSQHNFALHATRGKFYTSAGSEITSETIVLYTPAVVYENGKLIGTLYSTQSGKAYASMYEALFKSYLNKVISKKLRSNKDKTKYRKVKGFDIGHIDLPSGIGTTPGLSQVDNIMEELASISEGTPFQIDIINEALAKASIARDRFTVKATYSSSIYATFSKNFRDSLISIKANVVIAQEARENRIFGSTIEAEVLRDIKTIVSELHSSRNLKEEIPFRILAAFKGVKVSPTNKIISTIANNFPTKKVVSSSKITALPKVPLRTNQGQFYSLTSLQTLINTHLQNVISANMGDEGYPGGQRRILNYRTGRFAASAQVERLSQSREGAITAFYSYMKNPYQVFEPGYSMGKPATRDPKLLIGKSIREIAATKVGNKLRAVSI